jgi:hypothetical protein
VDAPRASSTWPPGLARNGAGLRAQVVLTLGTECGMKKVLGALVVAFALFYMLTQPEAAADVVRGAVAVVGDAFTATIAFITALVQ